MLKSETRQIKLELLRRVDLPQLAAIAREVNLGNWRIDDYKEEIDRKDSYLLAAKRRGNVIGFIAVRFSIIGGGDESICSEADVINIGVLKNYQRKGIGSLLLNEFLIKAVKLKIKTVWLEVRESNAEARTFYKSYGFVEIQKRKNFYSHPLEDAWVMCLKLIDNLKISS